MKKKIGLIAAVLLFVASIAGTQQGASAPELQELEFRNQRIVDILAVLADVGGVTILPDDTVQGTATYFFSDTDFDQAFRTFLQAQNLHARRDDGVWHVSRVAVSYNEATGLVSVEGREVEPRVYLDVIGREIGKTVLYDPLPSDRLTINADSVPPEVALEIVVRRFPTYELVAEPDYYYVQRIPTQSEQARRSPPSDWIVREGDRYGLEIESARSREVVDRLFTVAEQEYVSFSQSDSVLAQVNLAPRPFNETLRYLLDQANLDYTVADDGTYVLLDLQRRDVLRRYLNVEIVRLSHLSAGDIPNLLPPDFAGADLYRIDQSGNRMIFAGSRAEIDPLVDLIRELDRPQTDRVYYRYDVEHIEVSDLVSVLPRRLASENPRVIPRTNSFVVMLTPALAAEMTSFVETVDVARTSEPIRLRYIRAQDLLEHLPPSVAEESIVRTQDSSLIFYRGSEEGRERFLRELELIDQPAPQIRYQLLVIQYQLTDKMEVDPSYGASQTQDEDAGFADSTFLGTMAELLTLDFDIVSTFGYQFALDLSAELSTNDARVMADTTLNGLSGQEIRFQNTNTSRYREPEHDPDTGQVTPTGVISEITSGLIISIDGWTSGDGMITMDVSATVSSQRSGGDTDVGSLPPTSERIVNTHVRTESGTPIVIGGLLQQNTEEAVSRVPIIGDIPLLGELFTSRRQQVDNTELVIYIVPHLEVPAQEGSQTQQRIAEMYERLVRPLWADR
ncbi:MAG: hypothetical protein ACOC2Q_01000 [Spirochaetota bacterium]